jgi:hypothetical protein
VRAPLQLGDLLAPGSEFLGRDRSAPTRAMTEEDALRVLAGLAARYGVTPDALEKEWQRPTLLARVLLDVVGVQPPRRGRGRRPDSEKKWREFVALEHLRKALTLDRAFDKLASARAPVEGSKKRQREIERLKRAYTRARKLWSASDVPTTLAGLFRPAPQPKPRAGGTKSASEFGP